jgi:hypothetical protein
MGLKEPPTGLADCVVELGKPGHLLVDETDESPWLGLDSELVIDAVEEGKVRGECAT